jgi:uncharacterized protein
MGFKENYWPNVAIIGASNDRNRYSNKAVRAFVAHGYTVYPVNPNETLIEGIRAYHKLTDIPETVNFASLYLNPRISLANSLPEQLREKNIEMVIINPGAESDELIRRIKSYGIEVQLICSLMALGSDPDSL